MPLRSKVLQLLHTYRTLPVHDVVNPHIFGLDTTTL